MNLLEGVLSEDGLSLKGENGETVTLPKSFKSLAGRRVVMGLRPEHVTLQPQVGHGKAAVESVESLGADCLVHASMLGQNAVFRVDNHEFIPEVGTETDLTFEAQHVYWFDPETTKRIRVTE